MKKINKVFNMISLSILLLMCIGIGGTYLSDYLVEINWFGDGSEVYVNQFGKETVEWGARHYWYNWGLTFLFVSTVLRAVWIIAAIISND